MAIRRKRDACGKDGRRVQDVPWGELHRLTPISRSFGFDRGQPIDRYYIEQFLSRHRTDIHDRVLEIGDPGYTQKFGGAQVTRAEVLDVVPGNAQATRIGDLATGQGMPRDAFECLIVTQTLHLLYAVHSALTHAYAALTPGGVLLVSVPGISQIVRQDMDRRGDYWRFTTCSARLLFSEVFLPECVAVEAHGNVFTSAAFLYGLAAEELSREELDYHDPDYELLITVRAVKPV